MGVLYFCVLNLATLPWEEILSTGRFLIFSLKKTLQRLALSDNGMAVWEKGSPIFLGNQSPNEHWIVEREFKRDSGELVNTTTPNNGDS